MPKLVYRSYLFSEQLKVFVGRIVLLGVGIYALIHYKENPVVVSIVTALCVLVIIVLGYDQVDVYTDRIVHRTVSLWSLIRNSKGITYQLNEVKRASLPPAPSAEEMGVGMLVVQVARDRRTRLYPFFLELKDGSSVRVDTSLGISESKKIVDIVNSLL